MFLNERFTEVDQRLFHIEQKTSRPWGPSGEFETKSMGAQVADAPELKDFADLRTRPSRVSLEVKSTVTSDGASAGELAQPYRDSVLALPKRRLRIRDLLPVIQVSSGSVEYPRQTSLRAALE